MLVMWQIFTGHQVLAGDEEELQLESHRMKVKKDNSCILCHTTNT